MKRTRIAAVALATAAAALAPALVQAAAADGPASYLQDPAGGEKTMKTVWTKDEMHKLEAQFRFHPGVQYKTVPAAGPSGAPEWETKKADPKTLAWQPKFEFAWSVSDSTLVKKAVTTKNGKHPFTLYAVVRRADGTKAAEIRDESKGRPATGRVTVGGDKRIACDTGEYTVEWSATRSGYGTLGGTLRWDSSCEQYRTAFSTSNGPR
ncbi:hypothetical protein [Streptomyces sp. G-G2]|uniref:hypothetical protein n=1 Tax=Streptomyces sp. G-G2 TaxID=3046201 RepID=UPI0024BA0277|nr:hypothetical protein [Streptomyces sp. G-G2]MDJ0384163.1 hypothetical protein [Streptomyces sp. G-G2]